MLKKLSLCAMLTLAATPFACTTTTTPQPASGGNYSMQQAAPAPAVG
jgi:hypothetical protein